MHAARAVCDCYTASTRSPAWLPTLPAPPHWACSHGRPAAAFHWRPPPPPPAPTCRTICGRRCSRMAGSPARSGRWACWACILCCAVLCCAVCPQGCAFRVGCASITTVTLHCAVRWALCCIVMEAADARCAVHLGCATALCGAVPHCSTACCNARQDAHPVGATLRGMQPAAAIAVYCLRLPWPLKPLAKARPMSSL